jgi:Sec-independent protein translocase protein TatA
MSLGVFEILIVIAVFLIMGPKRIVNFVRSIARGAHDFIDTLGRDKKDELPEEEERDSERE